MTDTKNETLTFTDNNNQDKAILGTLEGPCASFIDPTRNNRTYPETLWDKVFDNPLVKEMIDQGGIPGELDHPTDRSETDSARIAILMKEAPKKKDGQLWAKFSILNTPLGKIAYTLAKAGFNLGISSRGEGDVIDNYDGTSIVDEDTYDFKCFDLVLLPAVKDARLHLVNESLNKQFDYKKALIESIQSSNEDDKKIMIETLNKLNIKYNTDDLSISEVDTVKSQLVENLQKALMENASLKKKITLLNQQLSVSNAKETQLKESINSYKASLKKLVEDNENSKKSILRLTSINENLKKKQSVNKEPDQSRQVDILTESLKREKSLSESYMNEIDKKDGTINQLNENISSLRSQLKSLTLKSDQSASKISALTEDIHNLKKDQNIKRTEYNSKIKKANTLLEKYRSNMNQAVDKYIQLCSNMLGVQPIEIKNRLNENYTFSDIDKVCEDLRTYKLNINSLPFDLSTQNAFNLKAKVKSNQKNQMTENTINGIDDTIDKDLLELLK